MINKTKQTNDDEINIVIISKSSQFAWIIVQLTVFGSFQRTSLEEMKQFLIVVIALAALHGKNLRSTMELNWLSDFN